MSKGFNVEIINGDNLIEELCNVKADCLITDSYDVNEKYFSITPQSEIMKLKCDYSKAKKLMGWKPECSLEEGINETEEWIKNEKC